MGRSSGKKSAVAGKEKLESSKKSDVRLLWREPLVHILLIAALGFLVYSNTFHSSFHWDDGPQITGNPVIKHIENFTASSRGYDFNPRRFIGYLTFAINYYFGGASVTGYHVVNLGIHLINAFLVYFLVLLTFRTPNMKRSAPATGPPPVFIALFSALLFVSHPLQTESVTYIVQRLASLAALFYLLSVIMYIKGRLVLQSGEGAEHGDNSQRGHAFSFVLYALLSLLFAVLAMKTKEIAFTLPIMIVLYEFIFFKSSPRKRLLFLLPVLLTLFIIPLSVLHSGKPLGDLLSDVTQHTRVQTSMSRWAYLMTEMSVIATYIRLIFFPINQNLDYGYPHYHSLLTPHVLISFLFLLAIFGLGVYLLYRGKSEKTEGGKREAGTGERNTPDAGEGHVHDMNESGTFVPSSSPYASYYRLISFGIFWFFIALSVESSIIPIVDVIFEHRVYLPSAGFFIAITAGAFVAAERLKRERAFMAVFVVALLVLSCVTYERNTVWKNETSLWQDVVLKSPGKARPHANLGYFYMKNGHPYKARQELLAALKINPDYVEARTSLGNVYLMQGRRDDALRELQSALKINPRYTEAHIDLGNLYASEGHPDKAMVEYQTVLKIKPDHAEAHISLGNVYLMQGRRDDALREYHTALKLSPDDFEAHNNLGNLYFMENRLDDAIKEYKIALKLNPDALQTRRNLETVYRKQGAAAETAGQQQGPTSKGETQVVDEHMSLGNTYYRQGRLDDAVREYRKFLKSNPGSAEAHNNLGNVYYKQGRLDEAFREYKTALKLRPGSAEVHNNLGKIYGRQGHLDKALEEFRAAVKLNPDFADAHNMLGNVYGLQGHLDKALKEYETALKLNPDSADAHNNMGTIYYRQGQLDKALKEFRTASRLDPNNPGIRRNLQALRKQTEIK